MKILVNKETGAILAASDLKEWNPQIPDFAELKDVDGTAETYDWPNGSPSAAKIDKGSIVKDESVILQLQISSTDLAGLLIAKKIISRDDVDALLKGKKSGANSGMDVALP